MRIHSRSVCLASRSAIFSISSGMERAIFIKQVGLPVTGGDINRRSSNLCLTLTSSSISPATVAKRTLENVCSVPSASTVEAVRGEFYVREIERDELSRTRQVSVFVVDRAKLLEARIGVEPTNKGFAGLWLTAGYRGRYPTDIFPDQNANGNSRHHRQLPCFALPPRLTCASAHRSSNGQR